MSQDATVVDMDDGDNNGKNSDGAGGDGAGGHGDRLFRTAGRVLVAKTVADNDEIRRAAQHAILATQDTMAQLTHLAASYPVVRGVLKRNLRGLAQIKLAAELLLSSLEEVANADPAERPSAADR